MPAIAEAISRVTGTVYAEEVPLEKPGTYGRGSLDTGDGVIYFKRTVRVIPGELCIKYENEELRIPADAELYSPVSYTHLDVYKRQLHGLESREAEIRLEKNGPNKLAEPELSLIHI